MSRDDGWMDGWKHHFTHELGRMCVCVFPNIWERIVDSRQVDNGEGEGEGDDGR